MWCNLNGNEGQLSMSRVYVSTITFWLQDEWHWTVEGPQECMIWPTMQFWKQIQPQRNCYKTPQNIQLINTHNSAQENVSAQFEQLYWKK